MLNDIKDILRVNENDLDMEVIDLIDAAKADLMLSGVHQSKIVDTDPLIKRATALYCKAQFGYEDTKLAERFMESYMSLKQHLTLSQEYTTGEG